MRSDTRKRFKNEDGEAAELKTSYIIHYGELTTPFSPKSTLSPKIRKRAGNAAESYRPIASKVAFSPSGKAVVVRTPGKTPLYRQQVLGSISFFSNIKPATPARQKLAVRPTSEFNESEVCQAIKEANTLLKSQSITITSELLRNTRAENKKANFRRCISQNKVMVNPGTSEKKGSATQYARQLLEHPASIKNVRWEWLHLIAHAILGGQSQTDENLVAGTAYANTNMMLIESQLHFLAEQYPEGFTLEIKASLKPKTHVAEKIDYYIKTSDFTLPLSFDAQTLIQPQHDFRYYMENFVKELTTACKEANLSENLKHKR